MEKLNCSIDGFLNLSASPQAKPICSDYSSAAKAFHALLKFAIKVTINPGNQSPFPPSGLISQNKNHFVFSLAFFKQFESPDFILNVVRPQMMKIMPF